jgi:hypothetical protein
VSPEVSGSGEVQELAWDTCPQARAPLEAGPAARHRPLRLLRRLSQDERHGSVSGLQYKLRQDAGVRIDGELVRGVAEHDLDGLPVDADGKGQPRGAVTQIVQPDREQIELLDQAAEDLGEILRVVLPAVLPSEDAAGVDVRPVRLGLLAVLLLPRCVVPAGAAATV